MENIESQENMWIENIYGPIVQGAKEDFWLQLEMHRYGNMHLPCIIAGDFNVTISPEENKGGSKVRDPFGEILEDVIKSWRLINIKKRKGNTPGITGDPDQDIYRPGWIAYC